MAINATNPARERLKKGELAIGVGLRQARTVDIAPIMSLRIIGPLHGWFGHRE